VIEILKSFEQEASRFSPAVLVVPGLAMVALGLVAWLAGMFLRRFMLALAGAVAGGAAGWLLQGANPAIAALAAGGGAVFGAVLPRLSAAAVLAALGMIVALTVMAGAYPAKGRAASPGGQVATRGQETLTAQESLAEIRLLALNVLAHVRSIARELEMVPRAVLAVVGVILLVLGLLFARLTGALVFSVLGTLLVFAGLIVLLIFKGSGPIGFVQRQAAFYGVVLLGMAAFGALEQLVLCPSPARKRKTETGGLHPRLKESEHGWRNR
jgi:hypothetical protein